MFIRNFFALLLSCALTCPTAAQNQIDLAVIGKIREEGLQRSQVMEHISWLCDVYGPRLTGSPAIKQASAWAQGRFKQWLSVHSGTARIQLAHPPFEHGCRRPRATRRHDSSRYHGSGRGLSGGDEQ